MAPQRHREDHREKGGTIISVSLCLCVSLSLCLCGVLGSSSRFIAPKSWIVNIRQLPGYMGKGAEVHRVNLVCHLAPGYSASHPLYPA